MILAWLRRWLCRCPEPTPVIENTGYTVGFTHPGGSWGVEVPADQLDRFALSVDMPPPYMQVHAGGDLRVTEPEGKPRHLRLVDDAEGGP